MTNSPARNWINGAFAAPMAPPAAALDTGAAKAMQSIGPDARTPDGDMETDAC